MALKRCSKGHYYEPESHTSCPYCGIKNLNQADTKGVVTSPVSGITDNDKPTVTVGRPGAGDGVKDPGVTVRLPKVEIGVDPVVGWLVCIEGQDKGKDYRIRTGNNAIGRDPSMDICITGDETISRIRHARLSYDPKAVTFNIYPGDGKGLVYVNDAEIGMGVKLKAYDVIEIGRTKLLFIPLCGDNFIWK